MAESETPKPGRMERALAAVERVGNRLPDPAVLFIALLFIVWILSWMLSALSFDVIDPSNGQALVVNNQLSGSALTAFLSVMVTNFGTVTAMMLPYSVTFLIVWTIFLLLYWMIGLPLGLQASYTYPP